MPIVDKNRLKGNQGASLVASWLSGRCLVRPVTEGTDVGIDLFCETVDQTTGQPHMHFWVQVKAGKQVKLEDGKARCAFSADHIDYWSRQPVPVYAFLIAQDQLQDLQKIFVISFARKLLKEEVPVKGGNSRALLSDLFFSKEEGRFDLRVFVDCTVRVDHVALAYVRHGLSIPMPQISEQYVQERLLGFRAPHAHKAIDQIRLSASYTMMDILRCETVSSEQRRQLHVLAEVLVPYTRGIDNDGYGEEHYEDYWVMGLYSKLMGRDSEGGTLLTKACQVIKADKQFHRTCGTWQDIVAEIEDDIEGWAYQQ